MKRKLLLASLSLVLPASLLFTTAFAKPAVQPKVSAERIYADIARLAYKDDARVAGTEGEHQAAAFIAKKFRKMGLEVQIQKFPFTAFINRGASLKVNQPEAKELGTHAFEYSASTPDAGITQEIVDAGLGGPDDFSRIDAKGKIALIKRGGYTFYEKTENAAKAGAVGVLIYNNVSGTINGTLGQPSSIPALALSDVDGVYLKGLLDQGSQVVVTMKADTEIRQSYSQNVIATLKADQKASNPKTIVLGAHYDGVDTPAANDNASGTATMLEVARILSKKKWDHQIRFIAFGAEEAGLVGSEKYVESLTQEQKAEIAGMINMDMVGVGDTLYIMTAADGDQSYLVDAAEQKAEEMGIAHARSWSNRSDHVPFANAGIPVAFLHYAEDPNYHTDQDTLDKIQKEDLYNAGTLAAGLLADLADEPKPRMKQGKKVSGMDEFHALKHRHQALLTR
ncbi:DUF4910 domain-containing protein [Lihuaxuella thermophila]|uniref:Aminopeptidase YwaD n=1 Tax=Lihuaxuella thermophila TaxID=1173111 RepID=A0A1H8CE26_9BACL|nr:DUF4910 domain-containing protein [Lihuaxuella thermophila]SEM93260.1 aminopeptidase YwaD [Lihuaxuella thermophila]